MTSVERHCGWWKNTARSRLLQAGVAFIVAVLSGMYLHQRYASVPTLTYDIQTLPFEPLLGGRKSVITILSVANERNVPLTGVELRAEFAGEVYHYGTTDQGRAFIQIGIPTSDARTAVCGNLGRLPVGRRLSVGVISSGPLTGEPEVISNEVVGTRTTARTDSPTAYRVLVVAVCVLALSGAIGYLLLLFIRRATATTEWTRALAEHALAHRRGSPTSMRCGWPSCRPSRPARSTD